LNLGKWGKVQIGVPLREGGFCTVDAPRWGWGGGGGGVLVVGDLGLELAPRALMT
jgi:hypothetical protein